ncbi:MAG TPA: PAS domain S-box protein [Coleofasciculaceae cyanobacterium]
MSVDYLLATVQNRQQRLAQLQQGIQPTLSLQQQQELIVIALEELSAALEDLKVANNELQTSSSAYQGYQELFDFIPDGCVVTDLNGVIQQANGAAALLLNYSQLSLIGKSLFISIREEDHQAFASKLAKLSHVDEVQEWEMCLQPLNRTSLSVAVKVAIIPNQEGVGVYLRWLLRDITQNHPLHSTPLARERLLDSILTNAPMALYALDSKGVITFCEGKGLKDWGLKPSQLVGWSVFDLYHQLSCQQDSPETVLEQLHHVLAGKESTWIREVNGAYYENRATPLRNESGQITGAIAVETNITKRMQAEAAVREREECFRQLAENIHEVFWMSSTNLSQLRSFYVSPAYEDIWGRTRASLDEQPSIWIDAIHPEDRQRAVDNFKSGMDQEYRIVRPDGSIRWIHDRAFPVRDETGQIYRLAGIAEDITVRKLAQEEINKTLQRERELSELKSRFIATTSHEFRTPLTTIQSSVELLERYRHKLSEEKQLTHLQRIQTATKTMTEMLNDILLISEAEAGKLQFNPKRMDLEPFCRELVEELQQGSGKQHVITFTSQCQGITTYMDKKLLRHILSNLLSNAIKYSPCECPIQFNLTRLENKVLFQIQDQGIGIPPEYKSCLFEPFHRATNVGMIQGTGLGLAIVKECVDLHQGEITVDSAEGRGTMISVTLPLGNTSDA